MTGIVVKGISAKVIGTGCPFTVRGLGFSAATRAFFSGESAEVQDYDDDYMIITAPRTAGKYTLYLGADASSASLIKSIQVVPINETAVYQPQGRSVEDYRDLMLDLLPRGFAWCRSSDGNFWKFFHGLAFVLVLLSESVRSLCRHQSPSHTSSLVEWERELALPETGITPTSDYGRLCEIYRKECIRGGCTVPYFRNIADLFGETCAVYEYWKNPEKFNGFNFGTDDPNFFWMVELAVLESDETVFTCTSSCNEYLRDWFSSMLPLEKLFQNLKPSHTKLIVVYKIVENIINAISFADGSVVSGDAGEVYVYG